VLPMLQKKGIKPKLLRNNMERRCFTSPVKHRAGHRRWCATGLIALFQVETEAGLIFHVDYLWTESMIKNAESSKQGSAECSGVNWRTRLLAAAAWVFAMRSINIRNEVNR
jgi:hypothetical protein